MVVVDRLGVITNDVFDYNFDELCMLYRRAIDPAKQKLVKALRDRQIYTLKTSRKAKCK